MPLSSRLSCFIGFERVRSASMSRSWKATPHSKNAASSRL